VPNPPDAERPRLRADAASNRARLLEAARTVFGRDGVAAPLSAVADEAGVGIATLYRRFPDRGRLIAEAFAEALAQYTASTEHALAADDPWDGFAGLVVEVGEIEARNRGFTHLIQSEARPLRGLGGDREAGRHAVDQVVRRGQAAGVLRGDLAGEDLPVISFAIAGILETTRDDVPDAWRRHVALVLDGCRAAAAVAPLPPAPEPRALHRAMLRSARRRQSR
jgi:AcrR family transcriptional regulator